MLADITIGDVLQILNAEGAVRARRDSGAATFRMLREMGIFGPGVPTLREILDTGQRTVEELVDRYPITCRPVRDLIVGYLKERQPAIEYVTLHHRSYELAGCFWADLERHHPGIGSLRLPRDVAASWKQRLAWIDLDGDAPVQARGSVVDRCQDVAAATDVIGGYGEISGQRVGAQLRQVSELVVVAVAVGQGRREDGGVRGHADNAEVSSRAPRKAARRSRDRLSPGVSLVRCHIQLPAGSCPELARQLHPPGVMWRESRAATVPV